MFTRIAKHASLLILSATLSYAHVAGAAPSWEQGFANPPDSSKPWCYWYWISDNISKEGITRDLEAMARVGIGEALIGNIHLDDVPAGKIKVLSEEWWQLVEHAIREGGRVGVNIGMFNCPGWSQSGGPWVKPEQAMRYLVSSETRVKGPARLEQKLTKPKEVFQDVAVLAFPAPEQDGSSVAQHAPRVTCTPAVAGTEKLLDGKAETAFGFPAGAGHGKTPFVIEFAVDQAFTARSLSLTPGNSAWAAKCDLQAEGADGQFRSIREFKFDRSNMGIGVGPMPRGPVTILFPATAAKRFRLSFRSVSGNASLAELDLSPAARVESFVEKQLGKMHPTPLPMWDTYLWPAQPEVDSRRLAIAPGGVVDVTSHLGTDGTLRWEVPAGDWIILRTGMTPTGTRNSPASPEGQGLEVDKMNRAAAKLHFDAFIGQVLKRMPASDRRAFTRVVADSYEMGSQNWTDGFADTFRKRYGYEPKPWLPVLTGRVVGSVDESDRFLWDLRRLVADHIATDYVGGLRDLCRPHGLQLWLENYGHWGFPAEFLQYGGQSDRIGGEFWVTGDLGSIELRAASSCANTYGKPVVSAEAFTGGPAFQTVPSAMKARGDWAFCEGISHFVLHVYIQQPWEDRKPGINAWFGTEFNRHNTWFEPGKAWMDYLRRCCFLLQQGTRVADVAYFIGEDAPKMTGIRQPELPPGRDFDYINAEVILDKLTVKNGRLALPHGTSYPLLVLPDLETMRPEVLRKIRDLVRAGATVLGTPPSRSPSRENFPSCDDEVKTLATELWGGTDKKQLGATGNRPIGQGRVVWGSSLNTILNELGVAPDFQSARKLRFTHRTDNGAHIYFLSNPRAEEVATTAAFRVSGLAPELWWPDSGRVERPAVYDEANGATRLPIQLGPHGSVFVMFREKAAGDQVVGLSHNGQPVLDAKWSPTQAPESAEAKSPANNFTIAVWARPAADTTLLREANKAVSGLSEPRNDLLFPAHGNTFGDTGHAGSGLAVGRNGVVVFEHGASYFAPVLVHPSTITNWVHIAVVYREGQPTLYLDGRLAKRGLKSDYIVHPSIVTGGGSPFRGESGAFEHVARALNEAELGQLLKTMPQPASRPQAGTISLLRHEDGDELLVSQPGTYSLQTSGGSTRSVKVKSVPAPIELLGPWQVHFAPGWNAPESVNWDRLLDWTQSTDDGIKHYSGTATYRIAFDWNSPAGDASSRVFLDLGKVRELATIRLNGRHLGTLWIPPWRLEITKALRPGNNALEIDVVNAWNNRLAGDSQLPREKRVTYLAANTVKKGTGLMSAGLMGPVTVQTVRSVVMSRR